jgi:hypothetical protein
MIMKYNKKLGLIVNKNYEKKRKILESEVRQGALNDLQIDVLLDRIDQYEKALDNEPNATTVHSLMGLYNKAIEYYSAINNEKHKELLKKLQDMFIDERVQNALMVEDAGITESKEEEKK